MNMGQSGAMIADAGTVGLRYAKRLLEGLPADRYGRFATPGNQVVESNHPAFILGHLSLYPAKVLALLGSDAAAVQPPEEYHTLFSKEAKCVDDPDHNIYPAIEELSGVFVHVYEKALEVVRQASDEQLAAENPIDTPMKQVCPTLGALLCFYLTGHLTTHLGQLSAWRRMEGLPPA